MREGVVLRSPGREFHSCGATAEKARPRVATPLTCDRGGTRRRAPS
nr:hypothetical protein [Tanacetum cinerariifolium]